MKSLFSQVGIARRGSSPPLHQEPSPPPQMDADVAEVMGSFASPKRFGHHGTIGDACTLSYEPVNGLLAVASRGGMVKISGAPGVELVLEEEGSTTAEDPPAHLLFPTPHLLVGVTATGAVLAWNLLEGTRSGNIPAPFGPTGLEERVTAAHCRGPPDSILGASEKPSSSGSLVEKYVFVGFESGRVCVVQVSPALRASGYVVDPRDVASGAPEGILEPGGFGGALGAVTAIACSANGALALFGHRHGGIVLWDWVRKKRLALRSLDQGAGEEDEDREVTSLAFHPGGEAFAAGFASGCYSVFSTSSSHDSAPPRWVREGGDDGSCPREGPTIVRTAVSLVRWVGVRGGEAKTWGLLVAGGIEIEEGEDPDGVSLLVPTGHGAGAPPRAKAKGKLAAALAELETAVFVPFAIGQERLSHVHAVMSGGANGSKVEQTAEKKDGGGTHIAPTGKPEGLRLDEGDESDEGEAAPQGVDQAPDELVVLALVTWNEEVRGENGRLQFRRASSIKACPIQTSPYVALLQLEPERIGPHISGFAAATAVASTPLLSSSTIHDFVAYLGVRLKQGGAGGGSPAAAALLRGGGLAWADSVPASARDEGLCTSEMLVVGHADGWLSFWECCGPASRQDGISISEGRVLMREIPSGAALLGSLPAAELTGGEGVDVAVTALDVWIERDHVAAAERDACWVAVGFDSGEATVLVLSSRMDAGRDAGSCGDIESGGGTPLATKPVEISNVELSDGATDNNPSSPSILKSLIPGLRGRKAPEAVGEAADEELEAAIAEARAEARAIEAQGVDEQGTEAQLVGSLGTIERKSQACARAEGGEEEDEDEKIVDPQDHLRREISDAMADEGGWGSSTAVPPSPSKLATTAPREEIGGEGRRHHGAHRKASLVQLALRLHGHAVRCVALSYDTGASALALVVADAEGVVSVTDVSTGSASLLPMRAPQTRPCRPGVTIGPLPSPLCRGNSRAEKRGQGQGAAGALFVFLEGWLNVFDLASRDPVDVVQVPGLARDEGGVDAGDNAPVRSKGGTARREDDEAWMYCVDERGVPLAPYASEPLSSAISPSPSAPGRTFGHDAGLGEGDDGGRDEGQELGPRSGAKTIWVSPAPSRTTLDGYHEHELQVLSDAPPPRPFLLVVHGAVAVVLEVAERDTGIASAFSILPSGNDPNVAAFKGRSGAEMVVRSRMEFPRAEGRLAPPRVDRAGVCMVAAGEGAEGKAARRGCLMATDASGILTGFLLPSLTPVFRDRLPLPGDGAGLSPGVLPLSQRSVCNLLGELTLQGTAGEFTRWTVLTDEACDKLVDSKPRHVKVSKLVRQATPSERPVGRQPSDGSSAGESSPTPRSRKSMLRRLSLGGSRKSLADVFSVEPSHRPASRQQSGGSAHSFSSTASAPTRRGRGDRRDSTEAQRQDLFGEREDADGGNGAAGSATAAGRAGGGVSEAHAAVSEARDLAIERGEKLENMVDKTRELEDSALAFGDMAKQLRRQREDEACSIS